MSLSAISKRAFVAWIVAAFFSLGVANIASAAIVSTGKLVAAEQIQNDKQQLKTWMARADVRDQLVQHGVDVDSALSRVDSMTAQEVAELSTHMQDLPAGSGFVETAVLAFLVLVVLEVSGVTDVLPNI
jgi:uncharacterized membrane protein YbhN (UPF0104 family)